MSNREPMIPNNIESRKFPGHTYRVGYDASGYAWRIVGSTGDYAARPSRPDLGGYVFGRSLNEIGAKLREIVAK